MALLLLILRLLLALALYAFLGTVLYLLWRDLYRPVERQTPRPRRYGRLVVVDTAMDADGAARGLKVGTAFPLQPITSLGRAPVNTVIIPDTYASAEHALLIHRGEQWWLEDRGSRNGTKVNAVTIDGPTVVSAGDVIGIGQVRLKLELGEL
jgi:membrane protein implicated in regulation of membrane protease activity